MASNKNPRQIKQVSWAYVKILKLICLQARLMHGSSSVLQQCFVLFSPWLSDCSVPSWWTWMLTATHKYTSVLPSHWTILNQSLPPGECHPLVNVQELQRAMPYIWSIKKCHDICICAVAFTERHTHLRPLILVWQLWLFGFTNLPQIPYYCLYL